MLISVGELAPSRDRHGALEGPRALGAPHQKATAYDGSALG